jgi:hypothetical protein
MVEVSRRALLAGALAMPMLAGGCAAEGATGANVTTSSPDPNAVAPANLLEIGATGRIRGANIGPGVDDFRGDSAWAGLWQRWDWDGRIKNELDDALAAGANCVRLIGNTHVVTADVISKDDYLHRWSQFLAYTKSLGLWVYPCGGDLSHWGGYTTLGAAEDIYRGWADALASYDHVVGVDITNEAPAQSRVVGGVAYQEPESWLYTIKRLGEMVRTVSGKPIAHSRGLYRYDAASWQFGSPETDAISDFLDVHAYRIPSPADAELLFATEWGAGKQLLIGEFGANMTIDSPSRTAAYGEIKAFISNAANCVGGLAWTIYDTGTDPASLYGLYDQNRAPRADIATPFGTFPVTR